MIWDPFGERVRGCLFYIIIVVLLYPSSRGFSISFNQWILDPCIVIHLELGLKKTVTFHFAGWHQPSTWQHTFFCCCYASYITPIICAQNSMISIIPQISEGQGTRIATVILLPIIEFTSTLPLMVKYCYLASGIPEFCARDAQFFLLIPACSGIHYWVS